MKTILIIIIAFMVVSQLPYNPKQEQVVTKETCKELGGQYQVRVSSPKGYVEHWEYGCEIEGRFYKYLQRG